MVPKRVPALGLKPCGHVQEGSPGPLTLVAPCSALPAPWRVDLQITHGSWDAGVSGPEAASLFLVPSRGAAVSAGETSWVAPFPFISESPGPSPASRAPFVPATLVHTAFFILTLDR